MPNTYRIFGRFKPALGLPEEAGLVLPLSCRGQWRSCPPDPGNLFQTLLSFSGMVDASIEFQFGLFADNKCRVRDGMDNKALGL